MGVEVPWGKKNSHKNVAPYFNFYALTVFIIFKLLYPLFYTNVNLQVQRLIFDPI